MRVVSVFILQLANLVIVSGRYAHVKKIFSERILNPSVQLCSDEFENFYQLNVVFIKGFRNDESCHVHSEAHDVEDSDLRVWEAHCNYDKDSAKTAEDCESLNGVLYDVQAEKLCDHDPDTIIDTKYENASLCVGQSCDVEYVLERYKREIESEEICSVTFQSKRLENRPKKTHAADLVPTKYGACENIKTGLLICVLASQDCAPWEVWLPAVEHCKCKDVNIGFCESNWRIHADYCAISNDECNGSTFIPARSVISARPFYCRLCSEDEIISPPYKYPASTSALEDGNSSSPAPAKLPTLSRVSIYIWMCVGLFATMLIVSRSCREEDASGISDLGSVDKTECMSRLDFDDEEEEIGDVCSI